MKPEIITAEWEGKPTFIVAIKRDGKIWRALWKIEGIEGGHTPSPYIGSPPPIPDAKPIWTDRITFAWHSPDIEKAKYALSIVNSVWDKRRLTKS